MKVFTILFIAFITLCAGCGSGVETSTANEASPVASSTPAASAEPTENECKICDFDFAAYKGELEKKEVEGLLLALNDEYMAMAIYQGVNKKFNDPRPFSNIVRAEEQHAQRLIGLFETYKIPVPKNPWTGNVPEFDSVKAACEAGVQAEVVNKELYGRLFETTKREDITLVYKALQRASEENHMPAFERCAAGNGGGNGPGNRNGMGRGAGRNN